MRNLLFGLAALAVMALAFWAYQENYKTRQTMREVQSLQRQIAAEREALAILNAEWAYLNRPDRLRELVEINYGQLGLLPMTSSQFGRVDQVAYPALPSDIGEITTPIEVAGQMQEDRP